MASDGERERGILSTKDRNYLGSGAGIAPKSSAERVARARSESGSTAPIWILEFSSTN